MPSNDPEAGPIGPVSSTKKPGFLRVFLRSSPPPIPDHQPQLPEPSVNIISRYTYSWIYPLLRVRIFEFFFFLSLVFLN